MMSYSISQFGDGVFYHGSSFTDSHDGQYDVNGKMIRNLGAPIYKDDLVTKCNVDHVTAGELEIMQNALIEVWELPVFEKEETGETTIKKSLSRRSSTTEKYLTYRTSCD
ncbi:hypothetical protein PR048_011637 [Dryococelus australis]|uniref:Uncharacterized protein n=1 Tax=Dryococelus australis TaxID=614101 RepID=A0ABQ9HMB8_9NEOP|nr:hypothetical protein PR048_011637 [Dryococelus australis]